MIKMNNDEKWFKEKAKQEMEDLGAEEWLA